MFVFVETVWDRKCLQAMPVNQRADVANVLRNVVRGDGKVACIDRSIRPFAGKVYEHVGWLVHDTGGQLCSSGWGGICGLMKLWPGSGFDPMPDCTSAVKLMTYTGLLQHWRVKSYKMLYISIQYISAHEIYKSILCHMSHAPWAFSSA